MVRWSAPGSAVYRLEHGADAMWTTGAQLQAMTVDSLNDLFWLLSAIHRGKGTPIPKQPDRIPRPGVKQRNGGDVKHIGEDPIPAADFNEWWTKGYRNG